MTEQMVMNWMNPSAIIMKTFGNPV